MQRRGNDAGRAFDRRRLLGLAVVALALGAAAPPPQTVYEFVGLIPEPTTDADQVEIIRSIEAWADYMRVTGVGEFRSHLLGSVAEAERFIAERRAAGKTLCFGVMPGLLAHQKGAAWRMKPLLCPVSGGNARSRHVLVALRSAGIASVDDLQGKRVAAVKTWAETPDLLGLVLSGRRLDPARHFAKVMTAESQRECLIAVLRRQADAALVKQPFFEHAQKKNRKVWSELAVVQELPEEHLPPFVVFDEAPTALTQAVKTHMLDAATTPAGRHVLDLFHIDGFQPCGTDDFAVVEGALLQKLAAPPAPAPKASP